MSAPGRWSRRRQRRRRFPGLPRPSGVCSRCRYRRRVSRRARSRSRGPGRRRECRALPEVRGRGREVCRDRAPPGPTGELPCGARTARRVGPGRVRGSGWRWRGGFVVLAQRRPEAQTPRPPGADPAQPGPPCAAPSTTRARGLARGTSGPRRHGARPVPRPGPRRPAVGAGQLRNASPGPPSAAPPRRDSAPRVRSAGPQP